MMMRRWRIFYTLFYLLAVCAMFSILLGLDVMMSSGSNSNLINPDQLRLDNLFAKVEKKPFKLNPQVVIHKKQYDSNLKLNSPSQGQRLQNIESVTRGSLNFSINLQKQKIIPTLQTTTARIKEDLRTLPTITKRLHGKLSFDSIVLSLKSALKNIPNILLSLSTTSQNPEQNNQLEMVIEKEQRNRGYISKKSRNNEGKNIDENNPSEVKHSQLISKESIIHLSPVIGKTKKASVRASKLSNTVKHSSPPIKKIQKSSTTKSPNKKVKKINLKREPLRGAVMHDIDKDEIALTDAEIKEFTSMMIEINEQEQIHNLNQFGTLGKDSVIILVQVHSRERYLQLLIDSLTSARYINETLVIFSHDIWKSNINEIISKITAFSYMQIFFPFSVQTHPNKFPGRDSRDCRWNHIKKKNKVKICLNEEWADTYGHYREHRYTQIKHHWWWKINRVFDGLNVTRDWTGELLFLEEDHYVTEDFLHVLKLLRKKAETGNNNILSIGNFNTVKKVDEGTASQTTTGNWGGPKYNLGFAFSRGVWKTLRDKASFFCTYDDYNWDWTLAILLGKEKRSSMLATKLTRVYHHGSCGTHSKTASCDQEKLVKQTEIAIKKAQKFYFPKSLSGPAKLGNNVKQKSNNGGWRDYRDIQLCNAISNGTASEATIERLQFREFQI